MTLVTDCPFEIKPREPFVDILGKVWEGVYESDYDWVNDNMDACIWFLQQLIYDPSNGDSV